MEAFAAFFQACPKKAQKKYYPLVPEILNILPPLKEAGDSENLTQALIALIDLAEEAPLMFKHLFHNLVQFSVMVMQDKQLSDQTRQNALELMGTFADYSTAMCKKDPSYTSDMVTQCLSLMTDVGADDDDASDWKAAEDVSTSQVVADLKLTLDSSMLRRVISTMLLENKRWTDLRIDLGDPLFCLQPSTGCPV